jgi:hypothetical protein
MTCTGRQFGNCPTAIQHHVWLLSVDVAPGGRLEPKWTLHQIVFNCQQISAIFSVYARMISPWCTSSSPTNS